MAIILGNSAVVNSSFDHPPATNELDAMRLNWGPYLWMRCYNNGAQFLDRIIGPSPDWALLEREGQQAPPGVLGTQVLPFCAPEPSLGVAQARLSWHPREPEEIGFKFRAALEALAYLIALGVRAHEQAGQKITRVSVSGGIARSALMCEILASVLDKPLQRLQSDEGPALGAAVTVLAALETHARRQAGNTTPFTAADAVARMVKFGPAIAPNPAWTATYQEGLKRFEEQLAGG
jgi:sugar (pentulose or hexulose) kinase